jgi:putative chitinase
VRGHSEKTTPAQLKGAAGGKPAVPKIEPITNSPLEKKLMNYAAKAGLEGEELAQFLAQCAHETMDFRRMVERGSPSYFKKYERSYAPNQARILGNIHRGDGTRFKGRGYIQLTGRYNYARAERDLGLPLLDDPELAADPDHAARIAVWYWNKRVKPRVTDFTDTREVTEKINPGLKGLEDRHDNFIKYMESGD